MLNPSHKPGLLAVDVNEIIIASSELEGLLQPATGNALVVLCRADVEGPAVVAQLLAQPTPVASQLRPGSSRDHRTEQAARQCCSRTPRRRLPAALSLAARFAANVQAAHTAAVPDVVIRRAKSSNGEFAAFELVAGGGATPSNSCGPSKGEQPELAASWASETLAELLASGTDVARGRV